MFSLPEIVEILPVIVSLIVIEGLLSVDNALAIAALASHLPKHQQQLALKLGIIGAYLFRGLAMFFVAHVIANPWLKVLGSAYLIYLMASNLAEHEGDDGDDEAEGKTKKKMPGLLATILQIELMDLSLSIDNIVAAVALDKRVWVVCTGVFIGILALRFLAGYCIKLIEKFPILEKTAFLLIGFVGVILLVEISFELNHVALHIGSVQKFVGIVIIVALTIFYSKSALGKKLLTPVVAIGNPIMVFLDKVIGVIFWPLAKLIELVKGLFVRKPAESAGTDAP
jgi:tellurite resistance protein TerC